VACARCEELQAEIDQARQHLADAGREAIEPVAPADVDRELELARYLSTAREPDAASGYRAGWHAMGRVARPRLHDWQALWRQATRETDRLRSSIGRLLMEIERAREGG
jgi:hypothetical protein